MDTLTVDTRYGKMTVPAHDRYITRSLVEYGEYSPGETRLFTDLVKPGDVVVEAGANIGALTVPLAQMVGHKGKVFAFEPQRSLWAMLDDNLGEFPHAVAHMCALGEYDDFVALVQTGLPDNTGSVATTTSYAGADCVEIARLDRFMLGEYTEKPVTLLKIDVEGNEASVLRGATETIKRCKPAIYFETDRSGVAEECIGLLRELGYTGFWHHQPPLFEPDNWKQNPVDVFAPMHGGGRVCSLNILALPEGAESPDVEKHGLVSVFALGSASRYPDGEPDFASLFDHARELRKAGRHAEAEPILKAVVTRGEGSAEVSALVEYADCLADLDRYIECERVLRQALAIMPQNAGLHSKIANAYGYLAEPEKAGRHNVEALRLCPTHPAANWNHALHLLLYGKYEEGWRRYQWGGPLGMRLPRHPSPEWSREEWGEHGCCGTLYIHSEQGLGDTLMLLRFIPLIRETARAKRIILEVQQPLVPLLSPQIEAIGVDALYGMPVDKSFAEAFDAHVALFSLPRVLGIDSPDEVPPALPLSVPAGYEAPERKPGVARIGLCWKGSTAHANDRHRSLLRNEDIAALMAPLVAACHEFGYELLSLVPDVQQMQNGDSGGAPLGPAVNLPDLAAAAAVVASCDVVLTVDTCMAHLAGCFGVPAVVMLAKDCDWRWGVPGVYDDEGLHSPWYGETLTLARQEVVGEWGSCIEKATRLVLTTANRKFYMSGESP